MSDFTQKYLDKEAVNATPEVLPPDYAEWLDTQKPTIEQLEEMVRFTMRNGSTITPINTGCGKLVGSDKVFWLNTLNYLKNYT